jgi:ankyrin repeat protein
VSHDLTPEELEFLQSAFDDARNGDLEALVGKVDAGVPVNLTNSAGDTLLTLSAYHVQADLVRALLERGADHARVNDKGQTALAAAVFKQVPDAVEQLLAAGADPDLGGQNARATAQFFGLTAMSELLDRPR